jgi:hypothetical protein
MHAPPELHDRIRGNFAGHTETQTPPDRCNLAAIGTQLLQLSGYFSSRAKACNFLEHAACRGDPAIAGSGLPEKKCVKHGRDFHGSQPCSFFKVHGDLTMFRRLHILAVLGFLSIATSITASANDYPPELGPMVVQLEEVEAMLADGTFVDGDFALTVSNQAAATFAKTIKNKLRTAKSEYTRMPRKVRTTKEADAQWYRMDALIKTSDGFSAALQRHARALAEGQSQAPADIEAATASPTPAATVPTAPRQTGSAAPTEAQVRAAEAKKAAEAHAAARRALQEQTQARAAAVKAEKEAAARAKAAGIEPSGPDWQNSYIPNIAELESADGFFQWPWSAPSWKAVTEKAALEQQKGALGPGQVELFKDFVLDKADAWPSVPRLDHGGDAQYALDMIRKRESADGLEVVDLWISRPDWKIQRNALGAILSRSKPGYLLYRDPSGEGCILKQLWIKEPYAGGSNYEKTSSWRYARIRFQSCDRS